VALTIKLIALFGMRDICLQILDEVEQRDGHDRAQKWHSRSRHHPRFVCPIAYFHQPALPIHEFSSLQELIKA
jgi:hypothetical protein